MFRISDAFHRVLDWSYDLWLDVSVANRIRKRSVRRGKIGALRPAKPERLAVLGIMKNEAHLIEEWIQHNIWIGADRIFLIDNGSTDDTLSRVEPWLKDGRVELVSLTEPHKQVAHYWTAFQHFRIADRCEWVLICDIDEFFFCKSGERLVDYLDRQSRHDAVYVNGAIFGTNGHQKQPESVRRSLTRRDPRLSRFTKCMFRTWVPTSEADLDVHFVKGVEQGRSLVANRELQMNHYVTQSHDYWFKTKMTRGDVRFAKVDLEKWAQRYARVETTSSFPCLRLADMLERDVSSRQQD